MAETKYGVVQEDVEDFDAELELELDAEERQEMEQPKEASDKRHKRSEDCKCHACKCGK